MIAIVLPQADERLLSALSIQKCKDFKVYVTTGKVEEDPSLEVFHGSWSQVQEEWVCVLTTEVLPDPDFVKRITKTISRHPEFDVYHVNLKDQKAFPRKTSPQKFFQLTVVEEVPAPLSTFIFRTHELRAKAIFKADGTLDTLRTVLACSRIKPTRKVWRAKAQWVEPAPDLDPMAAERAIRERLDFFRWTEDYFGDDDYPLSVSDQLSLFAGEVAKLFPSYSVDDLKEQMYSFQAAKGAVRRTRATSALKSALKKRGLELQ